MVSLGYDIHAFLRVSQVCEDRLNHFLQEVCDVRPSAIWNNLHLTIYQGRLRLPGLHEQTRRVQISASTDEMRFMVLQPGGINPQSGINPRRHAIGIRLTRRNEAMQWINVLRQEMIEYEWHRDIIGRRRSTLKRNAFGPKEYTPHVKLLNRDNRISLELPHMREQFQHNIEAIEFTHFEVRVNAN